MHRKRPVSARILCVMLALMVVSLLIPTLSASAEEAPVPCVIASDATVRSGPGSGYSKIGTVVSGRPYGIYEQNNGYYRLWYGTRYGWVQSKAITLQGDASAIPNTTNTTPAAPTDEGLGGGTIAVSSAVVRSGPGSSYKKIGTVVRDRPYGIFERKNGFVRIWYGTRYGWIPATAILLNSSAATTGSTNPSAPAAPASPSTPASYDTAIAGGIIRVSSSTVRSGPGSSYSKIGTVVKDRPYGVFEQKNGYSRIWYGMRYGWIVSSAIALEGQPTAPNAPAAPALEGRLGQVNTASGALNVRATPSTASMKIGSLTKGDIVEILSTHGSWYYIESDGLVGYVSSQYIVAFDFDEEEGTPPPASNDESAFAPYLGQTERINWYGAQGMTTLWPRGSYATVIDARTRTVMQFKRQGGTNHADVEPATKEDNHLFKMVCYNGRWSWTRRPVWVIVNGRMYAGSINGVPHGGDTLPNNGMTGQVCIHFDGSQTHNSDKVCPDHQKAIQEAYVLGNPGK